MVAGPLKLAKKYQVDSLYQRIVSHLQKDWPTTLSDLDNIGDGDRAAIFSNPMKAAEAIDLARSCDVPSILPMAFYVLTPRHVTPEALSILSSTDLVALMQGKDAMRQWLTSSAPYFVRIDRWDHDEPACNLASYQQWQLLLEDTWYMDPLDALHWRIENMGNRHSESEERSRPDLDYHDLCNNCRDYYKKKLGLVRESLFDSLPQYFK